MSRSLPRDMAARPSTYKVVSDTNTNNLTRDLNVLDKHQSYVLKNLEREQKAFRRSMDTLQTTRSRSGSLSSRTGSTGSGLLGASHAAVGLGVSPLMSRHIAGDSANHRSVSAHLQLHSQPHIGMASPSAARSAIASKSRTRTSLDSSTASPSIRHHSYVSTYTALGDNSAAKSWSNNPSRKKGLTSHLAVADGDSQRATSLGDIRNMPDFYSSSPGVARPDHHRKSLPPVVPISSGLRESWPTGNTAHGYGSAPEHHGPEIRIGSSADILHGPDTIQFGYHEGSRYGEAAPLPIGQVKLVTSHNLFDDLTTSLPRITSSRPGTASLTTAEPPPAVPLATQDPAGKYSDTNQRRGSPLETADGEPDCEVLSNGIDDGVMAENAQGGKSLKQLFDDIKGCRYIRHYAHGDDGDDEDSVQKIFA